jgi:flagellar hook-length control protein FliK
MDVNTVAAANLIDPTLSSNAGDGAASGGTVDFAQLLIQQIKHLSPGASGANVSNTALMSVMDSMMPASSNADSNQPVMPQYQPAQTVATQQSANIQVTPQQAPQPQGQSAPQQSQNNQNTANNNGDSGNQADPQSGSNQSAPQSAGTGAQNSSASAATDSSSPAPQTTQAASAPSGSPSNDSKHAAMSDDSTDDAANQAEIAILIAAPVPLPTPVSVAPAAAISLAGAAAKPVQTSGAQSSAPGKIRFFPVEAAAPMAPTGPTSGASGSQSAAAPAAASSAASSGASASGAAIGSVGPGTGQIVQQEADLATMIGPQASAGQGAQSAFQISVAVAPAGTSSPGSLASTNLASLLPEGLPATETPAVAGIVQNAFDPNMFAAASDESDDEGTDAAGLAAAIEDSQSADASAVASQTGTTFADTLEAAAPAAEQAPQLAQPAPSSQPAATAPTFATAQNSGNTAQDSDGVQIASEAEQTNAPQAVRQVAAQTPVQQIKVLIEQGLKDGTGLIKVQLSPHDLGRVEVKLDVQDGQAKATVTADRPDTLQMLKSDQAGLQQALKDAGLNTNDNSISFYLRGDQQRQQAQQQQPGTRRQRDRGAGNDLTTAAITESAAANSSAAAGALDISV